MNFREPRTGEIRRLRLPRTRANKAKKEGRSPVGLHRSHSRPLRKRQIGRHYSNGLGAKPSKTSPNPNSANSSSISCSGVGPLATLSQSGATRSSVSATTRSKPPPHVTLSLLAGRLLEMRASSPSPPLRVFLEVSRKGPLTSQSGPPPPNKLSGPSSPLTMSLPSAPTMLSEPLPPPRSSLPEPPSTLSESVPPKTASLPEPPPRFLSPPRGRSSLPPRTQSLPGPPTIL